MITIATCLWAANKQSQAFSRAYTPEWADRLCWNFGRHLTQPFRFVVFTDRDYAFKADIVQLQLGRRPPDYGSMIEPFKLDEPTIVVGLDTIVVGNIDHLADYCLTGDKLALPISPGKTYACNGVALVPKGQSAIFTEWRGENDMEWLRMQPHGFIDAKWPGHVVSYKLSVRPNGLGDARIVYFHGEPKAPSLMGEGWVAENWR
jgi:hypothetical protein